MGREAPRASSRTDSYVVLKVDGVEYVFRPQEATATFVGELRRATGMSLSALLRAAGTDPDLDVLAALVWGARRQRGENVDYSEVADALGYGNDYEFSSDDPTDDDEVDSPEA